MHVDPDTVGITLNPDFRDRRVLQTLLDVVADRKILDQQVAEMLLIAEPA